MAELLIEIFTEELPAIPLLKNLDNIKSSWATLLKEHRLETTFDFFYTPRRLTLIHKNIALKQPNTQSNLYGPPLAIAYNTDGNPTKALESFLKKNNLTKDMLTTAQKDGKEVIFYQQEVIGQETKNLLADMVTTWLASMQFGKSMRWGDCKESFIRPIRNICILLQGEVIACHAYNLQGSNTIIAHRQAKDDAKQTKQCCVKSIESYLAFLEQNGVILQQEKRQSLIIQAIHDLEKQHNIQVEMDLELLHEIVAITEYPSVLLGSFDEKFLQIPKEMIITSMKENQRYFAVYKDSKLFHGFVMVSNSFGGDCNLIVKGNEKVLRARLEDAMFFYTHDRAAKMQFGTLQGISFMEGAGTLLDKVEREVLLAGDIFALLQSKGVEYSASEREFVNEAIRHAKCDLLSQSVGEFPELQGIMGAYFAKEIGMNEEVCTALREQYLPHGMQAALPSRKISALVNLANKMDTLFTLFHLNKIPSGSKDPFALRRQAGAILKIAHQFGFDISIQELCGLATKSYPNAKQDMLNAFITERIYGIFPNVNPSIVRCVLLTQCGIAQSFDKIAALASYLESADMKSVVSTFKRVANILEGDTIAEGEPSSALFEPSEQQLYNNLMAYKTQYKNQERKCDIAAYNAQIAALFQLKVDLDLVFENVLIRTDDMALRTNREKLIMLVFQAFMEFGDMRAITM